MRFALTAAVIALLAMAFPSAADQPGTRAAAILDRFHHANQWRDHIMVVGHRGGVRENGEVVRAENSLEAIEAAVALGIEVVEIDVQKTRDGVYVALHDSWLDRTTTCHGRLIDRTLDQLAECRLRIAETGRVRNERVPTLKAILSAARDRVLVNIDNKLDFDELEGIVAEARSLGMEEQLIVKQNLWNAAKVAEAKALLAKIGAKVQFMPIIADDAVRDAGFVRSATGPVSASAVELINWRREAGSLTGNGGALFRPMVRAEAVRGDWHMWVNTYAIVNKPAGFLAGGRGDQLAVEASNPDEVFGFWIEQGATIIQTDEPKAAIDWMNAHGYRRAYDLPAVSALADLGG
ncbi:MULTISPECIES: glycerophosphodiester phosphodiesterase family protein [Mesorhizobium]|uniref:Glycerophosphodiester phosphodiesterase n=1 Tax=Mesorhizobium denitrificans TaxID=2294114 RepID=A0A371XE12_9HYPH|nr:MULTISPECIES: glycerophosphodiester phosphodiesterase family protein [Mesorhizobium]RFC67274.1 glycerophosphodiester phosphodiesterase [Mesorhizobium denitrificans]